MPEVAAKTPEFSFTTLNSIIDRHKDRDGGLIPVLQDAQEALGYLPVEAVRHIARKLSIPYSRVAGVVSFYSFFTTVPRGRHTIRACMGTACYVRGAKAVLQSIERHLGIEVGGTTEDRLFSLEVGRCFGACGLAPVVVVDDDVHQQVKPSQIPDLLQAYRVADEAEGEVADLSSREVDV